MSNARNNLPAIIHTVEKGSAAELTRHCKLVAVLLSTVQYPNLTHPQANLWEAITSFRKSCASSDLLKDDDFSGVRDPSKDREDTFN